MPSVATSSVGIAASVAHDTFQRPISSGILRAHDVDVELRILGPLEVARATGRTAHAPARPRAGAAGAAARCTAAQVVALDRILDELWGADWPEREHDAVYVVASRLRAARRTRPRRLARRRLRAATCRPRRSTPRASRRCWRAAGPSCARGEPARGRGRRCAHALALWRGPALADVGDAPFAREEAAPPRGAPPRRRARAPAGRPRLRAARRGRSTSSRRSSPRSPLRRGPARRADARAVPVGTAGRRPRAYRPARRRAARRPRARAVRRAARARARDPAPGGAERGASRRERDAADAPPPRHLPLRPARRRRRPRATPSRRADPEALLAALDRVHDAMASACAAPRRHGRRPAQRRPARGLRPPRRPRGRRPARACAARSTCATAWPRCGPARWPQVGVATGDVVAATRAAAARHRSASR